MVDKKVVFFDVDNTIVNGYTQKFFIEYLYRKKKINFFVMAASYIWFLFYKIHIFNNVTKAINFYLNFLKGYNKDELYKIFDDFFDSYVKNNIYKDAKNIIEEYRKKQAVLVLVSTSIDPIVERLFRFLNFDFYISTNIKFEKDIFLGMVDGKAVSGEEKLKLAKNFLNKFYDYDVETYFYSDHFSDQGLLDFVDHSFVVNPDGILRNKAKYNNWEIINIK